MHSPDTREKLRAEGSEVAVSTPEEFEKWIAVEIRKWTRLIREAKIQAE